MNAVGRSPVPGRGQRATVTITHSLWGPNGRAKEVSKDKGMGKTVNESFISKLNL